MKRALFIPILLLLWAPGLRAQEPAAPEDSLPVKKESWLKRFETKLQTKHAAKERSGAFMITPLAGPGYTPELGFTIAGGVLMSLRTDRSDSTLQRSSFPVNIGYGTHNAFFISSTVTTFWLHDKLRVYADLNFKNMEDNYFGIGYEAGEHTPKSDTTTGYKRLWAQFSPQFLWQFRKNFFVGGGFDLNYTRGSKAADPVAADPVYAYYNPLPFNMGLKATFQYDSRDVSVNAYKGAFVELDAAFYGHYLGGQNNYQVYTLDARKYFPVSRRPGRLIAAQIKGRFGVGSIPYGEMSQLGTPYDLRGYLWGQYRDKSMVLAIAEYRHKFYKRDGKPSIHGVVAWVATGSIAGDISQMSHWLPNGGIGYRLEVQPRMNVRLDYGIGKGSHGFYFNFNEAF